MRLICTPERFPTRTDSSCAVNRLSASAAASAETTVAADWWSSRKTMYMTVFHQTSHLDRLCRMLVKKRCARCMQLKPSDDFVRGYCTPCNRAYQREYYLKNRERITARTEARRRANLKAHNARKVARCLALRREVIDAYGSECACCGEKHIEFLAIDHVNGNGRQERLKVRRIGHSFYLWLRRNGFPKEGFRVLCHNCNQSLGLYGYCPHHAPSMFPAS